MWELWLVALISLTIPIFIKIIHVKSNKPKKKKKAIFITSENTNKNHKEISKKVKAEIIKDEIVCITKEMKGKIGEDETAHALNELSEFEILRNGIFYRKNGFSCEIDIIVLHGTGIYVIENKNYDGDIIGSQKDCEWMQYLSKKRKYKFYNPLKQNEKHIDVLKEILGKEKEIFYNVIIFGEQADVSKIIKDYFTIVENRNDAVKRVEARMILDKEKLSKIELRKIYEKLIGNARFDEEARKEHIEKIKKWKKTKGITN